MKKERGVWIYPIIPYHTGCPTIGDMKVKLHNF